MAAQLRLRLLINSRGRGNLIGIQYPDFVPFQLHSSRGVATKLFVGGLSFFTSDDGLCEAFAQFGQVMEAKVIMDKTSERSKGFGFVTFASEDEAQKALSEMNGKVLNGRIIYVDYAKAKTLFHDAVPVARGPPGAREK